MADAYGGISLSTSKDCEVDSEALLAALNHYSWTNSNGEWVINNTQGKKTFWHVDDFNTQYPTLFPLRDAAYIIKLDSGELKRVLLEDATEDEQDCCWDIETSEVPLEEFSEIFSKSINAGWVEIACTANEKNRYVYFESLRVYADGRAQRRRIESGTLVNEPVDFCEIYPLLELI